MTAEQFNAAIRALGIRLTPDIEHPNECQWSGLDDPNRNDRGSVTRAEGLILAELGRGRRVIEFGTGLGVSTICLAHEAFSVDTIDPNEWVLSSLTFPPHVTQHDNFECITEDNPYVRFDFAFIDGLHDTENCKKDITAALTVLEPGSLVAFHDGHWETVRQAIDAFPWASKVIHDTVGTLTVCEVPR